MKRSKSFERKNEELRDRLETQEREGQEKWENFKKEFNHDIDELGQAIKDLFKDNVKEK